MSLCPDAVLYLPGNVQDNSVAGAMAVIVVYLFEIVHIHHYESEVGFVTPDPMYFPVQFVVEGAMVDQTGHAVGPGPAIGVFVHLDIGQRRADDVAQQLDRRKVVFRIEAGGVNFVSEIDYAHNSAAAEKRGNDAAVGLIVVFVFTAYGGFTVLFDFGEVFQQQQFALADGFIHGAVGMFLQDHEPVNRVGVIVPHEVEYVFVRVVSV